MSNDDPFNKKMTASKNPQPSHTVKLETQGSLVTPDFNTKFGNAMARFARYQEQIQKMRKGN